jgi:hypothetical protein
MTRYDADDWQHTERIVVALEQMNAAVAEIAAAYAKPDPQGEVEVVEVESPMPAFLPDGCLFADAEWVAQPIGGTKVTCGLHARVFYAQEHSWIIPLDAFAQPVALDDYTATDVLREASERMPRSSIGLLRSNPWADLVRTLGAAGVGLYRHTAR